MTLAGRLPTTRWSLVVSATDRSDDPETRRVAKQSLEQLCQAYWPALYGYLRRRGHSRSDAEDLIQGFFANLLGRDSLSAADQSRGRFRAFLYTSLDHYVRNEHRHQNATCRGGQATVISIDRERLDAADSSVAALQIADASSDPTTMFDREWASCLIQQTLRQLGQEYADRGKGEWFEKLSATLSSDELSAERRKRIAEELGLSSTALKVAIHRLRMTYRQRLIDAVAQTVEHPDECGSERQWLFDAFSGP